MSHVEKIKIEYDGAFYAIDIVNLLETLEVLLDSYQDHDDIDYDKYKVVDVEIFETGSGISHTARLYVNKALTKKQIEESVREIIAHATRLFNPL